MSAALWSTRQTNGGFLVSFFWPSSIRGGASQKKPRNRRRKCKKDERRSTVLPSATITPDTHPDPAKQARVAQASRTRTPINANPSAHCRSLSPSRLQAATFPLLKPNNLQEITAVKHQVLSRISLPRALRMASTGHWSPQGGESGAGDREQKFHPLRMPFHLWPPSVQQKYPQATSSASSASSEVSEDENSPIASRTRASTMQ